MDRAKILVVDDEGPMRRLLANILDSAGYEVRTAGNGLAALDFLKKEAFDLLVTDCEMPRMNGLELAACVRAGFPEVPVIAVSADGQRLEDFRKTGVAACLKKPFSPSELLDLARGVMGLKVAPITPGRSYRNSRR